MGMGWSYPCDIWSIACILIQLYTGDAIFQTHENREHLAMMEKALGRFPDYFIEKADRHSHRYFHKGSVVFPAEDVTSSHEREKQLAYVKRMRRLDDYVAPEDDQFLDLLYRLFEYDPRKRITAHEAMKHPFFDSVRDLYRYKPVYNRQGEK
jgi:dual-specificity kinase